MKEILQAILDLPEDKYQNPDFLIRVIESVEMYNVNKDLEELIGQAYNKVVEYLDM